jgi:hypothetical protein
MTDEVIEKLGFEGALIIYKRTDHVIVVRKLGKYRAELMLINFNEKIKKCDRLQLVLTIKGKRYLVTVRVDVINMDDGNIICEVEIVGKINIDIRDKLDEIEEGLRFNYLWQYGGIFCDEETLGKFKIDPKIKLFNGGNLYQGFIKNISLKKMNILSEESAFNVTDNEIIFTVNFKEPDEEIIINGEAMKKNIIIVEGKNLTDIDLEYRKNIPFRKRLIDYLKKENMLNDYWFRK